MSKPTQTFKSVSDIVKEFHKGLIAIPEIQRDVVWNSNQVKSLLDSITRGYPCGSIILWEPREKDKALVKAMIRPERVNSKDFQLPRYFLLDGQQRISSLASMILERSDLKTLLFELEEDMPYLYLNIRTKEIEATTEKAKYRFPWVLLNDLLNNTITSNPDYVNLKPEDKTDLLEYSNRILTYSFPTQIIGEITYEEVGEIFSRINSMGTQLTGAEIYLAKIVPRWKGITKEFRLYRKYLHDNYSFDIDITFIMKVLSTILCNTPQIKKLADKVVYKEFREKDLNGGWKTFKRATENSIKQLQDYLKVDRSKFIFSKNSIVPLVYYCSFNNHPKTIRKKLSKFFLLSQLAEHYGSASDTKLKNDIRIILEENNINHGFENLIELVEKEAKGFYRGLKIKPDHIYGGPSKNIFLLYMYICMRRNLATNFGPKKIPLQQIPSNELALHHIFPVNYMMSSQNSKKYMAKFGMNGYEYREMINDIANITFISQDVNSSISDTAPLQYLPIETTKETRRAHFIPEDPSLWNPDNIQVFLAERRNLLARNFNKIMNLIR